MGSNYEELNLNKKSNNLISWKNDTLLSGDPGITFKWGLSPAISTHKCAWGGFPLQCCYHYLRIISSFNINPLFRIVNLSNITNLDLPMSVIIIMTVKFLNPPLISSIDSINCEGLSVDRSKMTLLDPY